MGKLKKFWLKVFDILDDILAYILTVIGILCSTYLPLLKSETKIDIEMSWLKFGVAAVVALMLIAKQESLDIDENGSTDKSKAGRKRRFASRMFNALSMGMMWSQIIQLAS